MNKSGIYWTIYSLITIALYFIEGWMPLGICLTILGLIYLYFRKERVANRKKAQDIIKSQQLLEEHDEEFEPDNYYAAINYKIAVNEQKEIIKIYEINEEMNITEYPIPFEKIILSEIVMDNEVILKASRGNQVAGALIGGIAAGGIGAIIGGSSPNMKQNEIIQSITLKLIVDDIKKPNFKFDFLPEIDELFKGYAKGRPEVKTALERAEYWNSVMEIAIRKSNKKLG
ncbi:immunity protein [Niallia taxi]|uniref:immunity protein n=1 Tax=Niallia taxi TaxID=2499688 RepID=UPI0015F4A08E|nr:immunity protein [Niallia taxi]